MSAQFTPGPWEWFMHSGERPYLATPNRGRLYVMAFARAGMQGATPRFAVWNGLHEGAPRERMGGIMEDGPLLKDGSLHPDARLIAAAPVLLTELRAAREYIQANCDSLHDSHFDPGTGKLDPADVLDNDLALLARIDAAIAKATGSPA